MLFRSDPSVTTASAGQLVINEVLANNESAVAWEGAFPDLVELYNGGSQAISLSGVSLSDDPQQPDKLVFPADATMDPGEYLVLTADDDVAASASRLGFGLDVEGDGLYLYDATGERDKARELLANSTLPIRTVARECGYKDGSFFAREFRRYAGDTPKAFRNQNLFTD